MRIWTDEEIEKGALREIAPHFYDLKSVTENREAHDRQTVYDHLLKTRAAMVAILKLQDQDWINETVGGEKRRDILEFSALFHDHAKHICIAALPDGTTVCKGHEILGAEMITPICEKLKLQKIAAKRIHDLIFYHGFMLDIVNDLIARPQDARKLWDLAGTATDGFTKELMLIALSDYGGSDLPTMNKQKFELKQGILLKRLREL